MWAALFPGQGSQHPGMGRFLFDNFSSVQQLFEEASDTLKLDFKKLCFEGPDSELALTYNTQPALLLVSTASHQAVKETTGRTYAAAAGHSVGEYAALVAAGALSFTDALRAVRARGEYMQSSVPVGHGGMTAVMGLTSEQIQRLCDWVQENSGFGPVEPANYNAPGQIVISGNKKALDWMLENFDKDIFAPDNVRVRFFPLNVSAPFHCSMMKEAEEKMAAVLNNIHFSKASFPVIQNVSAQPVTEGDELRAQLIRQISSPVRWIECVEKLKTFDVQRAIELGSGRVLSGLVKKIIGEDIKVFNLNSLEDLKALEAEI